MNPYHYLYHYRILHGVKCTECRGIVTGCDQTLYSQTASVRQALGAVMKDLLQGDCVTQLLVSCNDAMSKAVLCNFCKTFYEFWMDTEDEDARDKFLGPDNKESIQQMFRETSKFCSVVGTHFMIPGITPDLKSLDYYLNYKSGPSMFIRGVRSMLSGEVYGDTTESEKESRTLLKALVQDTVRTSASCELLRPQMLSVQKNIDVDDPKPSSLLEACRLRPKLRDGLRKGEGKEFTNHLSEKGVVYVDRICAADGKDPISISSSEVTELQEAFNFMSSNDAVLNAEEKLAKYCTKHNQSIAKTDLHLWAVHFCDTLKVSERNGETAHKLDPNVVKNLLQKSGDGDLSIETSEACSDCVFYAIRELYAEAIFAKSTLSSAMSVEALIIRLIFTCYF